MGSPRVDLRRSPEVWKKFTLYLRKAVGVECGSVVRTWTLHWAVVLMATAVKFEVTRPKLNCYLVLCFARRDDLSVFESDATNTSTGLTPPSTRPPSPPSSKTQKSEASTKRLMLASKTPLRRQRARVQGATRFGVSPRQGDPKHWHFF